MESWSLVHGRWIEGETPGAEAYWFNVCGPDDPALDDLAARYGLHPLAVEDCRSTLLHAPKIDEFSDHVFIVLQAFLGKEFGPEPMELDVFLGRDFLITFQDEDVDAVHEVMENLRNGITCRPGPDGVLYAIADRAVDDILPLVNNLSDRLDEIEVEVLADTDQRHQQAEILELRSRAGVVRRLLSRQLSVFQRLSRGEVAYVAESNRIYFRDVYDHLVRIDLELEALREDSEVALTTLLSAVNNRLSEVMKVLSVVGALALPASLIAGIFGTNFDNVPGLHSDAGFVIMIGSMLAVAGSMAMYFRRKGWF